MLAELEHEELRELLSGSSSSSNKDGAAERSERIAALDAAAAGGANKCGFAGESGLSLLLGGKGIAACSLGGVHDAATAAGGDDDAAAAAELGVQPGRVYVPFSLSMRQLKHVSQAYSPVLSR
jgi:hypothetical protein